MFINWLERETLLSLKRKKTTPPHQVSRSSNMVQSSTILWSLIITALVSMVVTRCCLHNMRRALQRLAASDNVDVKAAELACFMRHWGHARRASHFVVAAFFLLFVYSIIGEENGYTIPLNGVYTIDMTLALLYWQALARVREAIHSAEHGGVYLDYILHRVAGAEDFVCSALMFNAAVAGAVGLSLVDWSAVKGALVKGQ